MGSGSTPTGGKSIYVDSGIKFIRSQNVYNDGLKLQGIVHIPEEINKKKSGSIVKPMDILLNITGGSIGRCTLIPDDFDIANVNQHVMIIRLVDFNLRHYIHILLCSNYIFKLMMDEQVGATKEWLSAEKAARFILPIPPLREQRNIIAKINSIQALIDDLSPLNEKIQSINRNMNCELKKSILQHAIQGKLIPQDPSEQPVAIECKNPIIRRDNSYYEVIGIDEVCIDDEIDYTIPYNWNWYRLSDVSEVIMGQSPPGESYGVEGMEFHQGKTYFGDIILSNSSIKTNNPKKIAKSRSILLSVRAPVGPTNITPRTICIGRGLCSINSNAGCTNEYLFIVLRTMSTHMVNDSTGSTFNAINGNQIKKYLIPIPPLSEQHRIVSKVKELQSLLDTLE